MASGGQEGCYWEECSDSRVYIAKVEETWSPEQEEDTYLQAVPCVCL